MAHVIMALNVPDIAGALLDDPVALVDLLITLSELDLITGGKVNAEIEMHLPGDTVQARTLATFLHGLIEGGLRAAHPLHAVSA